MRQLVGQSCALCHARIAGNIYGRFCDLCGCPVHTECAQFAPAADGTTRCASCGAASENALREQELHREQMSRAGSTTGGGWRNLVCRFCGCPMISRHLPPDQPTSCQYCKHELLAADFASDAERFGREYYLVTGVGPGGKPMTVRIGAWGDSTDRMVAEKVGIHHLTDVRPESPPARPSLWKRSEAGKHIVYCALLRTYPKTLKSNSNPTGNVMFHRGFGIASKFDSRAGMGG